MVLTGATETIWARGTPLGAVQVDTIHTMVGAPPVPNQPVHSRSAAVIPLVLVTLVEEGSVVTFEDLNKFQHGSELVPVFEILLMII